MVLFAKPLASRYSSSLRDHVIDSKDHGEVVPAHV